MRLKVIGSSMTIAMICVAASPSAASPFVREFDAYCVSRDGYAKASRRVRMGPPMPMSSIPANHRNSREASLVAGQSHTGMPNWMLLVLKTWRDQNWTRPIAQSKVYRQDRYISCNGGTEKRPPPHWSMCLPPCWT
jgi:hypothetical protein